MTADTTKRPDPGAAGREAHRDREEKERELLCKLPEDTTPDAERGERIETPKVIASGGKDEEACELPRREPREDQGPER
jgi:hypothetical protein